MNQSKKASLTSLANNLILISPFISGANITISGAVIYLHYATLIIGLTIIISVRPKIHIPRKILIAFPIALLISLTSQILSNNPEVTNDIETQIISSTAKLALAFAFVASFYCIYSAHNRSTEKLFQSYLKISSIFCYIAIFQEATYITTNINIPKLLGLTYKDYGAYIGVPSLSIEPAFFACAILPAACYHLTRAIKERRFNKELATTSLSVLISTSSLGIIGLIVCTALSLASTRKGAIKAILISPLLALPLYLITTTEFFQLRLQDTLKLVSARELSLSSGTNLSTYSIGVNTAITSQSIIENNGLGVGFGQYSAAFDQHIKKHEIPAYRDSIPGRGSATSFLLRISTELGLIGLAVALILLTKNTHPFGSRNIHHINVACASTFIVILLRMGEYYANGVIFIICLLIATSAEIKAFNKHSPSNISTKTS